MREFCHLGQPLPFLTRLILSHTYSVSLSMHRVRSSVPRLWEIYAFVFVLWNLVWASQKQLVMATVFTLVCSVAVYGYVFVLLVGTNVILTKSKYK